MEDLSVKTVEETLVREIAAILRKAPADIGVSTPLPVLGLDSMGFVELLVVIEKKFKLRLMESGLTREDFETIHALASRIGKGSRA